MAISFLEELKNVAEKAITLQLGQAVYVEAPREITDISAEIRGALYRAGVDRERIDNYFDIRADDNRSVGDKTVWRIARTKKP